MNEWNDQHRPAYTAGKQLRECACGIQTFSAKDDCPKCGDQMQIMPEKKSSVQRTVGGNRNG